MAETGPNTGPTGMTNHDLGVAFAAGNKAAARLVFTRFSPKVRSIARRFLSSQADVEDSVQEVFVRVFTKVGTLRNPDSFENFVVAIAVRTAREHLLRARTRFRLFSSDSSFENDERWAVADVAAEFAVGRLLCVLARVRGPERTAFVLRFMAGMHVREIAEHVGVSVPTARRRVKRAKTRVRYFAANDPFLNEYVSEGGGEAPCASHPSDLLAMD